MTPIERARDLCLSQGKKISQMEKDVGFANGYFNPKKQTEIAGNRVLPLAQYLGVSVEYLLTGEEKNPPPDDGGHTDDEFMQLYLRADPAVRDAVLTLLRSATPRPSTQDAGAKD